MTPASAAPRPAAEPGYTTTEWWGKLLVQLISLLVLSGAIHPAPGVVDAWAGIIGMVAPEIGYAISRGVRKRGTPG